MLYLIGSVRGLAGVAMKLPKQLSQDLQFRVVGPHPVSFGWRGVFIIVEHALQIEDGSPKLLLWSER